MDWINQLWRKKPSYPATAYWQHYHRLLQDKRPRALPFRAARMVVLDSETTGLNPHQDQLLSLSAVAVLDQQIVVADRFEAFFARSRPYQATERESVAVHGILQKHSAQAVDDQQTLIDFLAYLGNSIIVGHHIAFDFTILNNTFQKQLGGRLQNDILDTASLAKRLSDGPWPRHILPQQGRPFSLDQLCQTYKIPVEERHTASGDTILTALLLLKLLGRLEARGVKTVEDLLQ